MTHDTRRSRRDKPIDSEGNSQHRPKKKPASKGSKQPPRGGGGVTTPTKDARFKSEPNGGKDRQPKEIYRGTIFRDIPDEERELLIRMLERGYIYIGRYGCGLSRKMHKDVRQAGLQKVRDFLEDKEFEAIKIICECGRYFANYDEFLEGINPNIRIQKEIDRGE